MPNTQHSIQLIQYSLEDSHRLTPRRRHLHGTQPWEELQDLRRLRLRIFSMRQLGCQLRSTSKFLNKLREFRSRLQEEVT